MIDMPRLNWRKTLIFFFETTLTWRDSAHWCKHRSTSVCSTELAKYESPAKYPLNSCRYRFSEPENRTNSIATKLKGTSNYVSQLKFIPTHRDSIVLKYTQNCGTFGGSKHRNLRGHIVHTYNHTYYTDWAWQV